MAPVLVVLAKMELVTLLKNVKPKVELIQDPVPLVMESVVLVSLKMFLFEILLNKTFSVTVRCGAVSSENCTYFESSGSEVGGCGVKICRCDANVCQLRLDFSSFIITGPSTVTDSVVKTIGGQVNSDSKKIHSHIYEFSCI